LNDDQYIAKNLVEDILRTSGLPVPLGIPKKPSVNLTSCIFMHVTQNELIRGRPAHFQGSCYKVAGFLAPTPNPATCILKSEQRVAHMSFQRLMFNELLETCFNIDLSRMSFQQFILNELLETSRAMFQTHGTTKRGRHELSNVHAQ
jgi:hypothetical protein